MPYYGCKIYIPKVIDRILIAPLLLLRRLWYGYSFRRIPLANSRRHAIVDAEDYEEISKYTWWCYEKHDGCRAVRMAKEICLNRPIFMHRQIMNPPDDKSIDHKNRNGLDNRKTNLRFATERQNSMNRRFKKGTSKYKGVYFRNDIKRWIGQICVNYEKIYLGCFEDEIEAAKAYDKAAKKYFGEFAYLNFPPEVKKKGLRFVLRSVFARLRRTKCLI